MRLCKVKRSAIPFTTILRLLAAPAVFENLWAIFQTDGTVTHILIWPQWYRRLHLAGCIHISRHQACPLSSGLVSLVSGEVDRLCTQFVKIWTAVFCPFGWIDFFPFEGETHDLAFRNWIPCNFVASFVFIGWFRRLRPPLLRWSCSFSAPVCLCFLFPCPFRVCPLRARCVGVGVCSLPLLLRSTPRVPVK